MTLNKSLFNFGIFKNTLYRFKWGSLLYFVALFFSVPFMLLVADFDRLVDRVIGSSFYRSASIILREDYLIFPLLLAVAVPTVVAVLVFNNVHSAKQGVFTHSLPADRKTIYIANLLAAFVLMALPVLVNSLILMLMSFGKYGQVFSSMSVVYWTGLNLNMLFVMFAIATFAAFLTGNAAAHIGINAYLHLVPVVVACAMYFVSSQFLYGYSENENFLATQIMENNPIVWLFGMSLSHNGIFASLQTWVYFVGAILVYALAYVLYKNRKIEACTDVSAFKVFKPILKYSLVASVAVMLFGMLTSVRIGGFATFFIILVLTAITYFAAEMIMSKTFKVFKVSWKGYAGFALCTAVVTLFFAYTSVFGYETRVPKLEDIEAAAVNYTSAKPDTFDDPELIEDTLNIHKEVIKDIPVINDYWNVREVAYRYMRVVYKLKDGNTLYRRYMVPEEVFYDAMDKMYKSEEYKLRASEIDNLNIENIKGLVINSFCGNFSYNISLNDDASGLMAAIKKDVEELSYREMEMDFDAFHIDVHFDCTAKDNERLKYFKNAGYEPGTTNYEYAVKSFNISLNSNFKNAYAFLRENGYYDEMLNHFAESIVICKKPFYRAGELYTYKGETGRFDEFLISTADLVDISAADERKVAEILTTAAKSGEAAEGKNYVVFARSRDLGSEWRAIEYAKIFKAEELPEYLKEYVEQ